MPSFIYRNQNLAPSLPLSPGMMSESLCDIFKEEIKLKGKEERQVHMKVMMEVKEK